MSNIIYSNANTTVDLKVPTDFAHTFEYALALFFRESQSGFYLQVIDTILNQRVGVWVSPSCPLLFKHPGVEEPIICEDRVAILLSDMKNNPCITINDSAMNCEEGVIFVPDDISTI